MLLCVRIDKLVIGSSSKNRNVNSELLSNHILENIYDKIHRFGFLKLIKLKYFKRPQIIQKSVI